jgi:hypothetical protein
LRELSIGGDITGASFNELAGLVEIRDLTVFTDPQLVGLAF